MRSVFRRRLFGFGVFYYDVPRDASSSLNGVDTLSLACILHFLTLCRARGADDVHGVRVVAGIRLPRASVSVDFETGGKFAGDAGERIDVFIQRLELTLDLYRASQDTRESTEKREFDKMNDICVQMEKEKIDATV